MPIDTEGRIDRLLQRLHSRGLATNTTTLYSEGVKTKLRQAKFSLEELVQLVPQEDQAQDATAGSVSQGLFDTSELVGFYCDSFWDSLRSALDILGQLVNELRSLRINERTVDIKKVAKKVYTTQIATTLAKMLRISSPSAASNTGLLES